jgi:hypothetical protein
MEKIQYQSHLNTDESHLNPHVHYLQMRNRMFKMLRGVPNDIKKQIQWDEESCWSFTDLGIGRELTRVLMQLPGVAHNVIEYEGPRGKSTVVQAAIIDATSGCGGNVMAYAEKFLWVHAAELDPTRHKMLVANLNTMGFDVCEKADHSENVCSHHDNFPIHTYCDYGQNVIGKTVDNHTPIIDIISFDPPWGPTYKKHPVGTLRLSMSGEDGIEAVESAVNFALDFARYVVIKLPFNYDFEYFSREVRGNTVHTLRYYKPNTCVILIIEKI